MATIVRFVFISTICLLVSILQQQLNTATILALARECNPSEFVYGANHLVDELLTCSLSKSFDLDLTPYGNQAKSTSKTLIEQGISNRTSILHARLSGIWTAKRPGFVETGWLCETNGKTTSTSIIELSSLSLEVVEKLETPISHSQHKLAAHKPCKTFDLPTWMCRQTRPIYRTISTWANRAYYNLTLTQSSETATPTIAKLSTMFTCPETFRQRITYSPSSTYLLTRHSLGARKPIRRDVKSVNEIPSFGHTSSFTTSHSSNMPASPLYHNSVKVIIDEVTQVLRTAIEECIGSLEANLSLVGDYRSFKGQKYTGDVEPNEDEAAAEFRDDVHTGITNECSNKLWIKSRIELANQVNSLEEGAAKLKSNPTMKRNQIVAGQPSEPGELLNPYGFYHDPSADLMID